MGKQRARFEASDLGSDFRAYSDPINISTFIEKCGRIKSLDLKDLAVCCWGGNASELFRCRQ